MNEVEFNNLDFYGKLQSMSYICWDAKRRLEGIGSEYAARNLIKELMGILEENFNIYAADAEFNKEENFGDNDNYNWFHRNIKNVLDIVPLIKQEEASYSFLIGMLTETIRVIDVILPSNIRLARFLRSLSNCSEEIARDIGADEVAFTDIMSKMLDNVNTVNDILTKNGEIEKRSRR